MKNHQFKQYNLHNWVHRIIDQLAFESPTPIQQKVIPAALRRENIIGQSHTGSGKTHAFLLPLFNQLDLEKQEVQFVITSPTRELATQIYDEVKKMIQYSEYPEQIDAKLFIGGTDKKRVIEKLTVPPKIVVGTPGRMLDLIQEGVLDIYSARSFVVDEADLMLDLGLMEEIDQMLVRANEKIQLFVFSATIPERLQPFLNKYMFNPSYFHIKDHFAPETIEHRLIPLRHRKAPDVIANIAKAINPYIAIIFTNGKAAADELHQALQEKGLQPGIVHGGLKPRERKRVLKDIHALRYQYIVATDLAARGIDIKGVSHVINAQMPKEEEFYLHRVGRTARAGMEGTAINLYSEEDTPLIEKLVQRGITFTNYDVVQGEWREVKAWNERKRRKKEGNDIDKAAWHKVKKPNKVKPGYKKKMKYKHDKIKKQLKKNNNKNK